MSVQSSCDLYWNVQRRVDGGRTVEIFIYVFIPRASTEQTRSILPTDVRVTTQHSYIPGVRAHGRCYVHVLRQQESLINCNRFKSST
jgi:hypothetical protein